MTVYRSWDKQTGARGPARHNTRQTRDPQRATGGTLKTRFAVGGGCMGGLYPFASSHPATTGGPDRRQRDPRLHHL